MPSPCAGKARFSTEIDARKALRPGLTTVYRCEACAAWHVGAAQAGPRVGARKLRHAVHYGKR